MKRDEDCVFFFSLTFFLLVLLKEKFFICGISMGITSSFYNSLRQRCGVQDG